MSVFDDSLAGRPRRRWRAPIAVLRRLAEAGARLRRETADAGEPINRLRRPAAARGP